jgi:hypothetical protein
MSNPARIALSVCVLSLVTAGPASAALLNVNALHPFDTNLGTLNSVTVQFDPTQVLTDDHSAGFSSIPNHTHTFVPDPITITGLGTFTFPFSQTSVEDSNPFGDHHHLVDPLPAVKVFNTPSELAWFLDSNSPTITNLPTQFDQTAPNEGHQHNVVLNNIAIRTTFDYTPVPEPGSLALVGVASLALIRRRR